ncbi:TadE/TadG family type IV pilus assembly protein [Limobrevibacterium gyesilva]|uniref:Pilus assembly protein n=1 Tax=Limobrevibacterium gyesilva TaxID=2991712 RepID=A0AA42CH41_9PROT|nr:TadE/TadG family type IV pilus assembly protein [Limobrevibacterium gyesilva]MCW3476821.1 pilus assembly protein [Limobrevibacterium gyesilva]
MLITAIPPRSRTGSFGGFLMDWCARRRADLGPVTARTAVARVLPRGRRGATAVEFALVFPIFMLFTGMIMENGILLFQQAMLDNATADAARLIRTGQIQLAGGAATPFTTQLCNDVGLLIPCANIQYNVRAAATFAGLSNTVTTDGNGKLTNTQFTPGTPGQDVLVQVAWNRPYIIPWVGNIVSSSGSSLMISTIAFRNELYQ